MAKQVIFIDKEDTPFTKHSGILLDNGDLICGECGGLFESDERGITWDIVKEFNNWTDLDRFICDPADLAIKPDLKKAIDEVLEVNKYLFDYEAGNLSMEVFASYDDSLSDRQIADFIDGDTDPENAFYEMLDDAWCSSVVEEYRNLADQVNKKIGNDCYEDEILEILRDNVQITAPYTHFLNQDVRVTLIMDTGDGNYDYSINNSVPFQQKSAVAWLASTQGISLERLNAALSSDCEKNTIFLKSLSDELNEASDYNYAVTFLVKMPLSRLLRLNSLMRMKGLSDRGRIVLKRDTVVGLFDFFNGAGTPFEIVLDHDITVPISMIRSATPDTNKCQGVRWSVGEAYGMSHSVWKDTSEEISEPTF